MPGLKARASYRSVQVLQDVVSAQVVWCVAQCCKVSACIAAGNMDPGQCSWAPHFDHVHMVHAVHLLQEFLSCHAVSQVLLSCLCSIAAGCCLQHCFKLLILLVHCLEQGHHICVLSVCNGNNTPELTEYFAVCSLVQYAVKEVLIDILHALCKDLVSFGQHQDCLLQLALAAYCFQSCTVIQGFCCVHNTQHQGVVITKVGVDEVQRLSVSLRGGSLYAWEINELESWYISLQAEEIILSGKSSWDAQQLLVFLTSPSCENNIEICH